MLQILVVYVVACVVFSSIYIMWQFDAIQQGVMKPGRQYSCFMAAVVWVVLSSPLWIPQAIYTIVVETIREIRNIKV